MNCFATQVVSIIAVVACSLNAGAQTDAVKSAPAVAPTKKVLQPSPNSDLNTSTNDVIATTGTSDSTSSFLVRNSSLTGLFSVRSDGKVGIGTTAPTVALTIDTGATRAEANLITS